jgi:hypothetical protein
MEGQAFDLAIDRAVKKVEEITDSKLKAVDIRIDGLERMVESFKSDLDKNESAIMSHVNHLKELTEHHTQSMQRAIEVAFAAAKESSLKIETSFTKSVDSLQQLLYSNGKAAEAKSNDLKDRLTIIEARTLENKMNSQDSSARMFSILAIVVSVFVGIGEVYSGIAKGDTERTVMENLTRLQSEQNNLVKNSARNPVEKSDVDLLSQRLDSLSRRLNDQAPKTNPPVVP